MTSLHLFVYVGKTNSSLSHLLQVMPPSFLLHRDTYTSQTFIWRYDSVDSVNNWRWHSKVNLAPPPSPFSAYSGDIAAWLVCLSALTDTLLPPRLPAFPPAAVTTATGSHFGITPLKAVQLICGVFHFNADNRRSRENWTSQQIWLWMWIHLWMFHLYVYVPVKGLRQLVPPLIELLSLHPLAGLK